MRKTHHTDLSRRAFTPDSPRRCFSSYYHRLIAAERKPLQDSRCPDDGCARFFPQLYAGSNRFRRRRARNRRGSVHGTPGIGVKGGHPFAEAVACGKEKDPLEKSTHPLYGDGPSYQGSERHRARMARHTRSCGP